MTVLKMSQFGTILTGREFGKKLMQELGHSLEYPVALDFSGVMSLGSSFGDEIVSVIAKKQGGTISAMDANNAIWNCLGQIAEDHGITIKNIKRSEIG